VFIFYNTKKVVIFFFFGVLNIMAAAISDIITPILRKITDVEKNSLIEPVKAAPKGIIEKLIIKLSNISTTIHFFSKGKTIQESLRIYK
jgi:hypothetical protein